MIGPLVFDFNEILIFELRTLRQHAATQREHDDIAGALRSEAIGADDEIESVGCKLEHFGWRQAGAGCG